jgi:hypothetical protein
MWNHNSFPCKQSQSNTIGSSLFICSLHSFLAAEIHLQSTCIPWIPKNTITLIILIFLGNINNFTNLQDILCNSCPLLLSPRIRPSFFHSSQKYYSGHRSYFLSLFSRVQYSLKIWFLCNIIVSRLNCSIQWSKWSLSFCSTLNGHYSWAWILLIGIRYVFT